METFTCAQRGCTFEADERPADCPVCNNPMIDADAGAVTWESFTKAELIECCADWDIDIDGTPSRVPKAALIAALEAADLEPAG